MGPSLSPLPHPPRAVLGKVQLLVLKFSSVEMTVSAHLFLKTLGCAFRVKDGISVDTLWELLSEFLSSPGEHPLPPPRCFPPSIHFQVAGQHLRDQLPPCPLDSGPREPPVWRGAGWGDLRPKPTCLPHAPFPPSYAHRDRMTGYPPQGSKPAPQGLQEPCRAQRLTPPLPAGVRGGRAPVPLVLTCLLAHTFALFLLERHGGVALECGHQQWLRDSFYTMLVMGTF